ncbi:MAG TPA: efflux RND transporter periplasmic adaptor subunit, partial [Acidisoma sp.]|nr:efflux RND transporter periplasmic adaptor subunit [Acidisoma sp.]
MDDLTPWSESEEQVTRPARSRFRRRSMIGLGLIVLVGAAWISPWNPWSHAPSQMAQAAIPPATVTVSSPLQRNVDTQVGFLGQFSAVDRVELRAQVGGTLSEIAFQDGQIVKKGDLLFVIDPTPYQITLAQATAQLASAQSRLVLTEQELYRARSLKQTDFGTAENVDQRQADVGMAQAAVDNAKAQIRDAAFDLQHCRILAPFTGRIGAHQVSVGSLIAGSRFASGATTLLATIVSLNPIHLDFDMSEADYLTFARERAALPGPLADRVEFHLSDETRFTHTGKLDFVDNEIDRSSGTIHARATVDNPDLFLTPGAFARIRLAVAPPAPVLLVPDSSVLLDQDQHIVMTVAPDGTVVPKPVDTG